jgi:GT2 family glycosyltransferase
MTISAIVPIWNGEELLRRLLRSLSAQTLRPFELIAVDNGSSDGAPEAARQAGARVIAMGRNAGFAAAVNRGIGEASGDALAVLNTDVELSPDYLKVLAESLAYPDAWFATGKIFRETPCEIVDATFDAVCRGGTAARLGFNHPDGPQSETRRVIWSAPWTAPLFRAELFEKIGLLDQRYESYLEDVDFGLRCARLGFSGLYVPQAVARHRGSASLGRWHGDTVRRTSRNQVFLLARHFPARSLWRHAWAIAIAHLLWGLVASRHGAPLSWLRGKIQGLRQWKAIRSQEQFAYEALERFLGESERLILESESRADWYWKLYFLLAGTGAK